MRKANRVSEMAMIIRPLDEEVEVGVSRLSFMMMLV